MGVARSYNVSERYNTDITEGLRYSINIYALPSEPRVWTLIHKYFSKTGQLLPFIHEQSFCETYLQMKRDNFSTIRRTWLGLLNIMLAIAATLAIETDVSAQKRIEESDMYYQRAHGLCDRKTRQNISVELGMRKSVICFAHGRLLQVSVLTR